MQKSEVHYVDAQTLAGTNLCLSSDLAGEFPLYLYQPENRRFLLYSTSITVLLADNRIPKPLKISAEGISFLLQSGVVPPPKTAFKNLFLLSIGDKAEVKEKAGGLDITFSHHFPFLNARRLKSEEMQPDEDLILQMVAEATMERIDPSKPTFLFHSAGKDSNTIALALAEAGWQDRVTLISHQSKGSADESQISAKIAAQLGFKHQKLYEVENLQVRHKKAIEDFFAHSPLPCTDNVSLAYPLYACQIPELCGANLIDGGGNDSYMITPPNARERKVLPLSKLIHHGRFFRAFVKSETFLTPLLRTPAEWCGMSGFSEADAKTIFPAAVSVYPHWKKESFLHRDLDLFEFKTAFLTLITASEIHIRKVRNFADSISSNFVLPFANEKIARYFATMPGTYLFDRKELKNKLILRKILKERMGLDSDAIGKMVFSYDSKNLVFQNWEYLYKEINTCPLWEDQKGLAQVVNRLRKRMDGKGWSDNIARSLLYRLYLISAFYKRNFRKFI